MTGLVLSRHGAAPFAGMQAVSALDEALQLIDGAPRLWVIGGGEIYTLCLPRADSLHLTRVDTEVEGADAFFPQFDAGDWRVTAREPHPADGRHAHAFEFADYRRACAG